VCKMLAKEQRLFEQQQLLLKAVVHMLSDPYSKHVAAAARGCEGDNDSDSEYRPTVPAAAWRGLQLACYVGHCMRRLWADGMAAAVATAASASGAASSQDPASEAVTQLQGQLQLWEFELVQRHVWYSLQQGLGYCLERRDAAAAAAQQRTYVEQHAGSSQLELPDLMVSDAQDATAAAAAGGEGGTSSPGTFPLSEVLMADWVMLNLNHPALNAGQLMVGAAGVYAHYGLEAPIATAETGQPLPPRELNPLDPVGLAAVRMSGEAVQAAGWAQVPLTAAAAGAAAAGGGSQGAPGGGGVAWPRCSASLVLCEADVGEPAWGCSSCGRRYRSLPCRARLSAQTSAQQQQQQAGSGGGGGGTVPCVPQCLVCGLRLSPGGAAAAGLSGCSRLPHGVLDGSPAVAVGTSLSDAVLD
jgi:hypothetical protein